MWRTLPFSECEEEGNESSFVWLAFSTICIIFLMSSHAATEAIKEVIVVCLLHATLTHPCPSWVGEREEASSSEAGWVTSLPWQCFWGKEEGPCIYNCGQFCRIKCGGWMRGGPSWWHLSPSVLPARRSSWCCVALHQGIPPKEHRNIKWIASCLLVKILEQGIEEIDALPWCLLEDCLTQEICWRILGEFGSCYLWECTSILQRILCIQGKEKNFMVMLLIQHVQYELGGICLHHSQLDSKGHEVAVEDAINSSLSWTLITNAKNTGPWRVFQISY